MNDVKKGEEIIKAVFKASLQALFAIGVKSPEYVDAFTLKFSDALDREFMKIGLTSEKSDETVQQVPPPSIPHDTSVSIKVLSLQPFTMNSLKKNDIITIQDLMTIMQKDSLTTLKGIKEKSAKEILEKLRIWNKA